LIFSNNFNIFLLFPKNFWHTFYIVINNKFNIITLKSEIMGNKTNGLLALLGIGALAYWKYKKSTPEQQQAVKDKINSAKDNLNKWGNDLKDKANEVASQAQSKFDEAKTKVEDSASNI